ncbi:MAG: hypothetical protein VKL41_22390 [Snowella sp.]|nr:hypothetical protein [Snowella sp.]
MEKDFVDFAASEVKFAVIATGSDVVIIVGFKFARRSAHIFFDYKKGGGIRYQKAHKKGAEAPFLSAFNYSLRLIFFLLFNRFNPTPRLIPMIEPKMVPLPEISKGTGVAGTCGSVGLSHTSVGGGGT